MTNGTAYLDHAATSPLRPEALAAMLPLLTDGFGNPSGSHRRAREARRAVDDARDLLAAVLSVAPGDLVFTSGGTEADNLAVLGVGRAAGAAGGRVCCSAVEHPAVLEPCRSLGGTALPVDRDGIVDLDALPGLLDDDVALVSVMAVNNETGAIQPMAEIAEIVRRHVPAAVLHCDAVQALAWLDLAEVTDTCELVSVSGHKVGGPKGVGLLVVGERAADRLQPQLLGGPQERARRAGTPNVPAIVAMAAAADAARRDRAAMTRRVADLGERLVAAIRGAVGGVTEAVAPGRRVAGICNLGFAGVEAEELLILLDDDGVAASAGSACASGALEPSHVLVAMGRSEAGARGHVRFSMGWTTTAAEIDHAALVVPKAVERLRD